MLDLGIYFDRLENLPMKRNLLLGAMAVIWVALLPAWCPAQITGLTNPNPVTISLAPGATGQVTLSLMPSSTSIDGISGELHYDPVLLTNFRITPGPGAAGFFGDGFSAVPGIFTFVLYKSIPGGTLGLSNPIITVAFDKSPAAPVFTTTVSYAMEAAGQITNPSLGEVISIGVASASNPNPQTIAFGAFNVETVNDAQDWVLYE